MTQISYVNKTKHLCFFSINLHARSSSFRLRNFVKLSPKKKNKENLDINDFLHRNSNRDLYQVLIEHFHILDFLVYVYPKPIKSHFFRKKTDIFHVFLTLTCGLGRFDVMIDMISI